MDWSWCVWYFCHFKLPFQVGISIYIERERERGRDGTREKVYVVLLHGGSIVTWCVHVVASGLKYRIIGLWCVQEDILKYLIFPHEEQKITHTKKIWQQQKQKHANLVENSSHGSLPIPMFQSPEQHTTEPRFLCWSVCVCVCVCVSVCVWVCVCVCECVCVCVCVSVVIVVVCFVLFSPHPCPY